MTEGRSQRKVYQGRVVPDKTGKAVTVAVKTKKNHPIYGKCMNYSEEYKVHDESNTAKAGGIVRIVETCPLSATKRFRSLEVVEKAVIV